MIPKWAVLILGFGLTSPAQAQVFYQEYADDRSSTTMRLMAAGMIEGWGWANAQLQHDGNSMLFCWPANAQQTSNAVLAILDSYAISAPEEMLDLPFGLVLFNAIRDRFPC